MMMVAMRILKKAYPNPKRTIMVGHWSGEEEGLVGSAAWAADHPEITGKITAFINQDDGTGRLNAISGAGFLSADKLIPGWIARMPDNMRNNFRYSGMGSPSRGGGGGGTDTGSFACYGVPTFGLRSVNNWDYSNLTWHTEKDTYDKVSYDDLRWNATLGAMLAYLAADDPQFMTRNTLAQNDSLWKSAPAQAGGRGGGGRGGAAASTLPPGTITPCPAAVRKTNPRLR
jgi:Zn-dependent M28 family amino/carboxypeptidase